MCDKVVSKEPFMVKYCPDRYKIQKCVIKLLMFVCQYYNLFLIDLLRVKCLKYLMMLYSLKMI